MTVLNKAVMLDETGQAIKLSIDALADIIANKDTTAVYDGDGNVITETYAPLNSPAFTGNPTAPTQAANNNSTRLATTAYVKNNVPKSVGSGTKPVYTDSNGKVTASSSNVGDDDTPMYLSGGTMTAMSETLFSKIVTHLASAAAATISSLNTSSLFYRMLTWALTASGVQYNLTNSSAWYVCLGSLFGGLIIQGGSATITTSTGNHQITPSLTFSAQNSYIPIAVSSRRKWSVSTNRFSSSKVYLTTTALEDSSYGEAIGAYWLAVGY